MKKVLVVAPHADDETLGCGGTILRHIENGDQVIWLIITKVSSNFGYSSEQSEIRADEIKRVAKAYSIENVVNLEFPPAGLDAIPKSDLIGKVSEVIKEFTPEIVYAPYRNDAHTDHEVVYDAVMAATKTFRYPFVKRVLAYETISETDFGLKPDTSGFRPNVYIDIEHYLDSKLNIMEIYSSEVGEFPFPRSRKSLSSLAYIRGSQSYKEAAEGFMLIKEIL